ncbi:MAG: acyl carrier protein [Vicinamibacterales bacterium]
MTHIARAQADGDPGIPTVHDRLVEICCEELGVESEEVTPDASIDDDLGADSLDRLELALSLEQQYEIDISDADLARLRTVADVERYVTERIDPAPRSRQV